MDLTIVRDAITLLARPATLLRSTGSFVNGIWVQPPPTATAITAVVQAASEQDMRVAPEGERTDGYVTIWTTVALRTSNEDTGEPEDAIQVGSGPVYRIMKVAERPEGGFWRAIGRLEHDRGRSLRSPA